MDEQHVPLTLPSAPFPGPPPFWKHFTTTNRDRLKDLQASNEVPSTTQEATTEPHPRQSALPLELTYLVPPPPPHPSNTSYPAFSAQIPLSPTPPPLSPDIALPELANTPTTSLRTLTPYIPALLSKLTRSILLNFLELTTLLSTPLDPPEPPETPLYERKIADLQRLFTNALYCVNLYRPHQAREEVIGMLEDEVERGEEEIRRLDGVKTRVHTFLAEVEGGETGQSGGGEAARGVNRQDGVGTKAKEEDEDVTEARRLWKAIRELDEE